jgi:hypothetical protein
MESNPLGTHDEPRGSRVMTIILIVAIAVAVVAGALAAYVSPKFWGIESEPSVILYTGGLGLLAGIAGLAALFSGLAVAFQKVGGKSGRLATIIAVVLGLALLVLLGLRLVPR